MTGAWYRRYFAFGRDDNYVARLIIFDDPSLKKSPLYLSLKDVRSITSPDTYAPYQVLNLTYDSAFCLLGWHTVLDRRKFLRCLNRFRETNARVQFAQTVHKNMRCAPASRR